MYPSDENPNFGIFVKNFEDSFIESGGEIKYKSVLTKTKDNTLIKTISYLKHYYKILKTGLFGDYDIIYIHYVAHNSIPVLLISKIRKTKIVLNVHGDDVLPRTRFVHFLQYFVEQLMFDSDLIITPSLFFKEIIIEKTKHKVKEIFVSPSGGIDLNIFNSNQTYLTKKNNEQIILGFVSRIEDGKGWRLFLELIKKFKTNNQYKVIGTIVGNGSQDGLLEEKIKEYNLEDIISRLPSLNHIELSQTYKMMDLFIFPTLLPESLGLVGLESMACGTPVIGSNIGGLKSYIQENQNGFLFKTNDLEDLYMKTLKYLNLSQSEKKNIIINCKKTAKEYDSKYISNSLFNKLLHL